MVGSGDDMTVTRRRGRLGTVVALVVLTAVLFGALSAGSPVNGDRSVAAATAGISLGTASPHSASRTQAPPLVPSIVLGWLVVLLGALAAIVVLRLPPRVPWATTELRWHRPSRRGPPLLAV